MAGVKEQIMAANNKNIFNENEQNLTNYFNCQPNILFRQLIKNLGGGREWNKIIIESANINDSRIYFNLESS